MIKKIIFLLIGIFLVIDLAVAFNCTGVPETGQINPRIEVNFYDEYGDPEKVFLKGYGQIIEMINCDPPAVLGGFNVSVEPPEGKHETFHITPIRPLSKGYYIIYVNASDGVTTRSFSQTFFANVPSTDIILIKPRFGISPKTPFDIVVETYFDEEPEKAHCRYKWRTPTTPYDQMTDFDKTNSTAHKLWDVEMEPNSEKLFLVRCIDSRGVEASDLFTIGVDSLAPNIIEKKAIPETIVDYPLEAQLYVKTDDDTICKYEPVGEIRTDPSYPDLDFLFDGWDNNDPDAYKKENYASLSFEEPPSYAEYEYLVACENLAGLYSTTEEIDVIINLEAELLITVNTPERYTQETDITLNINSNKLSDCYYSTDESETKTKMTSSDNLEHTSYVGVLDEGDHTYNFECYSINFDQEGSLRYTFTIDRSPPSTPSITVANKTCYLDKLSATFSATDEESGVDGYNYTIKNTTENIVDWRYTTSASITVSGLDLVDGKSYKFVAKAKNKAGIESIDEGESQGILVDSTDPFCTDQDPPRVVINYTVCGSKICISLYCYDDTACSTVFHYGTSLTASCNASTEEQLDPRENNSYYFHGPITIDEPMYFCYKVSDVTGKTTTGVQFISFPTEPSCNNSIKDANETDIDCGGVCPPCDDGMDCLVNSDCKSGYCEDGICKSASCFDGVKNGYETDIDCGGFYCDPCDIGKDCETDYDCLSGYCNPDGQCDVPSCTDQVKNGNETDIDCGGNCPTCPNNSSCVVDADCESGNCEYGICVGEEDEDGDGIPDWWEDRYCEGDCDPYADLDNDGLNNLEEYQHGTDPTNSDTDGDGYNDGREVAAGTDPLDPFSYPESKALPKFLLTLGLLSSVGGAGYLLYNRYFRKPFAKPPATMPVQRLPVTPRMSPEEIRRRQEAMRIRRELMEKKFRERHAKKAMERESIFKKFGGKGAEKVAKKEEVEKAKEEKPPTKEYVTMEELAKKAKKKKTGGVFEKLGDISKKSKVGQMKKTESEVAGMLKKEPFEELKKIEKGRTKKEVKERLKKLAKKDAIKKLRKK